MAMTRKVSDAPRPPLCVECWRRPVPARRNWQRIPLAWMFPAKEIT